MSNEISKKDYLKRYLEKEENSPRKRKKKDPKREAAVSSLKIVDKYIDLKCMNFGDKAEEVDDDEAPVIGEITDDRTLEEKVKELYESSRWKKVNDDDILKSDSVVTNREDESKKYSGISVSLKEKSNSERNSSFKSGQNSSRRTRHDSDSYMSPPRILERMSRKGHDSSDLLPQRDQKRNSDSDISPPRSHKQRENKNKHDSDSDISPPRHQLPNKLSTQIRQKSKRCGSDSDISPPRHQISNMSVSQMKHKSKKCSSDSDISSPHHQIVHKPNRQLKISSGRHDSDSNEMFSENQTHSPVRLKCKSSSSNDCKQKKNGKNSDSDMSPPHSSLELSSSKDKIKKLGKTLSGLKAGLQNSKTLQKEIQEFKEREKNQLNMHHDGCIDMWMHRGEQALESCIVHCQTGSSPGVRYTAWGKGIEQILVKKNKLKDAMYEKTKPLARYEDDDDLDERLKSVIHDDDPMSEYIKKKRKKDAPAFPIYNGPQASPNRFGVLPGYRWDGKDRSNGYEKKYFEKINEYKAIEKEAYLWSIQEM